MTQKSKLDARWFIGMRSPEEKKEREAYVRNSEPLLVVILNEIEKLEQDIYSEECNRKSYSGDWAFAQAHRNGNKEALQNIKGLLKHIN